MAGPGRHGGSNAVGHGGPAARSPVTTWVPKQAFHVFGAGSDARTSIRSLSNSIRDLSGGALIMLPSSIEDFKDPIAEKKIIHTNPACSRNGSRKEKVKFLKACWERDRFGIRISASAVRKCSMRGARFVTACAQLSGTYDWNSAVWYGGESACPPTALCRRS